MRCLNCGQSFETPYCGQCGQKASSGRITGTDIREAVQSELHLHRGWLRTIVELTRRPGGMIRDYLDGHRVVYIGPVKYALTMMAVSVFLAYSVLPSPFDIPADDRAAAVQQALTEFTQRFGQILGVLHAPVFALIAWGIFHRSGRSYAEHLTANLYCTGHLTLVGTLFLPLDSLLKTGGLMASGVFYGIGIPYLAVILRALVARSMWTAVPAAVAILFGGVVICSVGWIPVLVVMVLRTMA